MSRLRRLLRGMVVSVLSLLVLLVLVEGWLQWRGYGEKPARYYDPSIGLRFHANQERMSFGRDGPQVSFRTNAQGFRGPWHAGAKPEGTVRIACLGDSFTFGWGVGDAAAYPPQLEGLLEAELGPGRAQVLNLGIPDHNAANALQVYRHIAAARDPDVVLLGWYLNDVQPDGGGPPYTDTWLFRVLGRTATMEWFHYNLRGRIPIFRYKPPAELKARREVYRQNAHVIEMEPDSALAAPFWARGMEDLRRLVEAVRADGRPLLVLIFPSAAQVALLREAAPAGTDLGELLGGPVSAPQRRVTAQASELGVPVLDLLVPFAECPEAPFGPHDMGHPSAAAFAVTARQVLARLYELGWLPSR